MDDKSFPGVQSIHRNRLGPQILDQLRELIIIGTVKPNSPVVERELAHRLGVSRTPLREALLELKREGFVTGQSGRGLKVSSMDPQEVHEIFPLIASIERFALSNTRDLPRAVIGNLKKINRSLAQAGLDPVAMTDLDCQWHTELLSLCGNQRAVDILSTLRRQARRFEIVHMNMMGRKTKSAAEHRQIILELEKGNKSKAAKLLEQHWLDGIEPMVLALYQGTQ